jgi:diaminohydroxyphosphoribosylaminopyrimidine deaminase / 5-amino-6-(5-phosphoribosylamino)uracil reductase
VIADFEKFMVRRQPHVTLKAAVTLDGKLATRTGDSRWITGEVSRKHAHLLRAKADAVLVGVGTVLADDPELTVRHVRGRNPLRVVLDAKLRTPARAKLVKTAKQTRTLILHSKSASPARVSALTKAGVELAVVRADKSGALSLPDVLRELHRRDVVRLLVEGGARVHGAFLDAGLVDRAAVFVAPRLLGDGAALGLAVGGPKRRMLDTTDLQAVEIKRLGDDVLVTGDVRRKKPRP